MNIQKHFTGIVKRMIDSIGKTSSSIVVWLVTWPILFGTFSHVNTTHEYVMRHTLVQILGISSQISNMT